MKPKKPTYRRAYRIVVTKAEKSEGPKLGGILVKDYFPVIGSMVTVLTVLATIAAGYLNTQSQTRLASLENDRKLLNDQFIDVQNRLSKADNPSERVNAVYSLVEMAQRPDPRLRDAPDDTEFADRLRLPRGWAGRLYVDQALRPCTVGYPYFKPAALRLANVVLLEPDQTVRNAAERGLTDLASFSGREIEGLKWEDFEMLDKGLPAIPLTRFLVDTLASADRDAWTQWQESLARLIGVAQMISDVKTQPIEIPRVDCRDPAFPKQQTAARTARMRTWLHDDPRARDLGHMAPNALSIWQLVVKLSPFEAQPDESGIDMETLDVVLNATKQEGFATSVDIERQSLSSTDAKTWPQEWLARQRGLRLASLRFLSTRDALAHALRKIRVEKAQYPPELRDLRDVAQIDESQAFPGTASKAKAKALRAVALALGRDSKQIDTLRRLSGRFQINLDRTALMYADLSSVEVPGVSFAFAQLSGTILDDATLIGASFFQTDLSRGSASNANLSLAGLGYTFALKADFRGARCLLTSFWYGEFPGANFEYAHLERATLNESALPWFSGAETDPKKESFVLKPGGIVVYEPPNR